MKIPKDMVCGYIHKTKNYGDLKIVLYKNCSNVVVSFCLTGYITTVEAGDIRKGSVRDLLYPNIFGVGYCGVGDEPQSLGGIKTKAYQAWYNMLLRCYSDKKPKRYKVYDDCYVCNDWHNFQIFSKWFNDNFIGDFELDKDILIEGNKVYSPETCKFVSGFDNKSKARSLKYSLIDPSGFLHEGNNVAEFCKINNLNNSNISMVMSGKRPHHKGWRVKIEQ